jgi:hypothetical protein
MLVVSYGIFHKRRRKIMALNPSKARGWNCCPQSLTAIKLPKRAGMRHILRILTIACAGIFLQDVCKAIEAKFNNDGKPFTIDGVGTWETTVTLIVPNPVIGVGEKATFSIVGNVTNNIAPLLSLTESAATVFGFPQSDTTNFHFGGPFDSFISIDGNKIFVGPANDWQVRAFDQVLSTTTSFSGTLGGVGASWTSQVQGANVADWFEPIGLSNVVMIQNRVLSESDHGKFTGSGASFTINGHWKDLGIGTHELSFSSRANYGTYGSGARSNDVRGFIDIDLSVPVTSVPGPIAGSGASGPDLCERWPSRLVATPSADCVSKASGQVAAGNSQSELHRFQKCKPDKPSYVA